MPDHLSSVRSGRKAVSLAAALAGAAACAAPIHLTVAPTAEPVAVAVRYYAYSPAVSVVGWDTEEAGYGLRATVRRNGSVVDEHRLYVSTYYFPDFRAFAAGSAWHAFTREMTLARPLKFVGMSRDAHSCEGGYGCSPYETLNARIPDEFLRAGGDDVVVKLHARDGREEIFVLSRAMIDAYLERVAAVSTALRRN